MRLAVLLAAPLPLWCCRRDTGEAAVLPVAGCDAARGAAGRTVAFVVLPARHRGGSGAAGGGL
jgi:hypothetical protein